MYFCGAVQWKELEIEESSEDEDYISRRKIIVPLEKEVIAFHSEKYAKEFKVDLEEFIAMEYEDENPKYIKFIGIDKVFIREVITL